MRFMTRLVLLSAAAVVLSAAATVAYAFRLADPGRDGAALSRLETELADAASAVRDGDASELTTALSLATRELAMVRAFRQDQVVDGLRGAVAFFGLQTACLIAALAATAFYLSSGLASLRHGIDEARRTGGSYRFRPTGAPDFREIAGELNRMLATVERQEVELREAAALQGWKEVASFLGHQLKNPLSAIALAAANAREAIDSPQLDAELRSRILGECAAISADEAARLKALVIRFSSLASFDAPRFSYIDIIILLKVALERRGPRHVKGEIDGKGRLELRADAELLAQAFANLIDNAVEAAGGLEGAPPLAGPVSVRVRVLEAADSVAIEFTDSNTGADPALASRLGKERASTKRSGSGLGLLFVRRIAAIHGGDLVVAVTEAGGLRFTLRLGKETAI